MGTWPIKVMVKYGLGSMFFPLGHKGLKFKRKTASKTHTQNKKLSSA